MPFPQAQKHQHPFRDTLLRGRVSRVEIPDISPRIWSRTALGIVPLSTTADSFEIDYRDPALLNDLQEAIKRARLVNELRLRMLAYGTHLEKSRFTNKLDQALANNLEMLKTTADQKGTEIGAVILPKHLAEGQQGDLKKIPSSHSSTQRLGDSFALSRESKQAQLIREVGVLYGRQLALVLDQQRKGLNPLVATPEKDIVTIYETIEAERAYGAVARRPREGSSLSYYVPTKEKVTEGLDPERVNYANQKLWKNNPNLNGRYLTLKAEDAQLREEWWGYYQEYNTSSCKADKEQENKEQQKEQKRKLTLEENMALGKLNRLSLVTKNTSNDFSVSVGDFSDYLKSRLENIDSTSGYDLDIIIKALGLWVDDPGNQWGEGWWDSNDLTISSPDYATVPASQYKCNAYVAESIFLGTGQVHLIYESEEQPGRFFPFRARDWGNIGIQIENFVVVTDEPAFGDVVAYGGHLGLFLGEYNGRGIYISARDNGDGVHGLGSEQHEHGIQIKFTPPEGGVFRRYAP